MHWELIMEKQSVCKDPHDPEILLEIIKDSLISTRTAASIAEALSALSDPTRIRVIGLLAKNEMCVGDLCLVLEMTQPAISHHLRILRNLNIVTARKTGRHVFYTLADQHIHDIFNKSLEHARHN